MPALRIAVLVAVAVLTLLPRPGVASDEDKLVVRLWPIVSPAPGHAVVRAIVPAHDENRVLEVTAQSPDFYRSSQVPLEGARAPRVSEIALKGLPQGDYEVTVILRGSRGARARVSKTLLVVRGER